MPILAAITAALAWATWSQAESPQHDSSVERVSYATSQAGASLQWRSYRAGNVHQDKQVQPTRHSETAESSGVAQTQLNAPVVTERGRKSSDPFSDPFGDGTPRMLPAAQPGQGSAKALGNAAPEFPNSPAPATDRRMAAADRGVSLQPLPDSKGDRKSGDEPTGRSTEDELAAVRQDLQGKCPAADKVAPIADIKLWTRPKDGSVPPECGLGDKEYSARSFSPITYTWKSASLCHKPLVFEEPKLERYGHSLRPIVQPVWSAAHFFLCVPAMPYILGVETPNECVYTLGYYRPGSCAPYALDPLPLSVRGLAFQGAAVTGFLLLMP